MLGLAVAGLLLSILGFERSVALLRRSSGRGRSNEPTEEILSWARKTAHLTSIAARWGPYRATCLRRSLFFWWLTRRRGLDSELKIGVRRDQGKLLAHAWIELNGEVLNDRPEIVEGYSPFDSTSLPKKVSWT
jgi:hypothetical protein